MPAGPGTYGSTIGRPKKWQRGAKARKALATQVNSNKDLEENFVKGMVESVVETYTNIALLIEKDWIQGAVNPKHKGFCTPMTKATCTPQRKALAKRFKKAGRKEKKAGGTGWEGKV